MSSALRRPVLLCALIMMGIMLVSAAGPLFDGRGAGIGPASRAGVDLGVEDIEVLRPVTGASSHYPGQPVTINVTVTNYGSLTVAAPFDVALAVNDGFANSTLFHSKVSKVLAPFGSGVYSTVVPFVFTPPLIQPPEYDYPHGFNVVATVVISNDEVQNNNQRTVVLNVMEANFQPELRLGEYIKETGLLDTAGYDPVVADVGGTLTVPFTLYNMGQGQDVIQVVCDEKPEDWKVMGFDPINLDDGANTTDKYRLIVKVSEKKEFAMQNVDHVIRLKAYSMNYEPAFDTLDIHFSIRFKGGVSIIYPTDEHWLVPGSVTQLTFEVENTGNGKDTIHCSVEPLRDISIQKGWSAYISQGAISDVLDRGVRHVVVVTVKTPYNVLKGSHCTATLVCTSVKSSGLGESVSSSKSVYIYASRLYNPVLENIYGSNPLMPGEEAVIYFNLTNDGNGRDDTIELKIEERPDGWVAGLDVSEIPASGLGYKTTALVGLKVIVPQTERGGARRCFTVAAYAGDPVEKKDELEINIDILEKFDAGLVVGEKIRSGYVGGVVEFPFTLKNTGNTDDSFVLSAGMSKDSDGWDVGLSETNLNLSVNMSKSLVLSVKIPLDAPADSNPATASIMDGYGVRLSVFSENDPVGSLKTVSLVVKVNPIYGFHMSMDGKRVEITAEDARPVPVEVLVENTGNVKDIIDLKIESEHSWCSILTIHSYLPYLATRAVDVRADPPLSTPTGSYEFALVGTSRGDKTFVQKLKFTVDVVQYNFRVQNVKIFNKTLDEMTLEEYDPETGYLITQKDTVLIQAEVVNTLQGSYISGPYGDVVVTFYEGHVPLGQYRVNISYLDDGKPFKVAVLYNSTKMEPQEIRIVVDGQNSIPESDETDNSESVLVNVEPSGPPPDDDDDDPDPIIYWIIPAGVCLFIIVMVFLTIYVISHTRIEYVETGYNEEGVYDPTSDQYDAFADEPEEEELVEEELEIDFDDGDMYSVYLPYKVSGGPGQEPEESPYGLPPESPYSAAAAQLEPPERLALPPGPGPDIPNNTNVEQPKTTTTQAAGVKPAAANPLTTGAVTSKPVLSSKPVSTSPVRSTKPVATTKPPEAKL